MLRATLAAASEGFTIYPTPDGIPSTGPHPAWGCCSLGILLASANVELADSSRPTNSYPVESNRGQNQPGLLTNAPNKTTTYSHLRHVDVQMAIEQREILWPCHSGHCRAEDAEARLFRLE